MNRRFFGRSLLAGMLGLLALASTARADVSVGANLGLAIEDSPSGPTTTRLVVPYGSGVEPGLRLGIAGSKRVHEGYLDTGYNMRSSEGQGSHALWLTLNYQYNAKDQTGIHPFVTAGGGIYNVGFHNPVPPYLYASGGATSATYGFGLGLAMPVSDGHGRMRLEVRTDRILEANGHPVSIESTRIYQIVVGFDLWMKRSRG